MARTYISYVGFVVQEARIHVAAPELKKWMDYYTTDSYRTNFFAALQ